MISTVFFSLSALCFAAIFAPSNPTMPSRATVYTYYVCYDEPLPTWQRKANPSARMTIPIG